MCFGLQLTRACHRRTIPPSCQSTQVSASSSTHACCRHATMLIGCAPTDCACRRIGGQNMASVPAKSPLVTRDGEISPEWKLLAASFLSSVDSSWAQRLPATQIPTNRPSTNHCSAIFPSSCNSPELPLRSIPEVVSHGC